MSEVTKLKLGKRLAKIESMVGHDYDHIWDCCCDHGLLGFQLLANNKAKNIHFVDVVPALVTGIEAKLARYYQGDNRRQAHCIDVAQLPIEAYKNEKQLIIIAGVGGLLLIELLKKLLPLCEELNVEFLISPVHHHYQLRACLINFHCRLIDELIISENKRFYEVLHITRDLDVTQKISLVGNKMWDFSNLQHQAYLEKTIAHYRRIGQNKPSSVDHIINAYQALLP